MYIDSFIRSYIKQNLNSLNEQANEAFEEHKQFMGTECKNIQNEEKSLLLDDLKRQIDSLHFDIFDTFSVKKSTINISKYVLSVSNKDSLWYHLKLRSHASMRYLIESGISNVFKIFAKRQWKRENEEWNNYLTLIDEQLNQSLSWVYSSYSDSKRPSSGNKLQNSYNAVTIKPTDRLIITKLPRLSLEMSTDKVEEVVQLSLQIVDYSLKDFCEELWEIIIRISGKKIKNGSSTEDLKLTVYNALRCTEDLCRQQIFYQLQKPNSSTFNNFIQDSLLFDHLKQFCASGTNIFLSESSHFWQLAYWSFRCGCINALQSVIDLISTNQQLFSEPREAELLVIMCKLLIQRLLSTTRATLVEQDAIWEHHCVDTSAIYSENDINLIQRMIDLMEEVRINPVAILLELCIQRDKSFIALRTVMPNATAEDFIWYHLTLASMKPHNQLLEDVIQLQKKILESGPYHFENDQNSSLAFVKISCLVLAPNIGLEWLAKSRPDSIPFCIYCLVYMAQHGITGTKTSIAAANFPNLSNFIGFNNIASAYEKFLTNSSATSITQLCELLPYHERLSVLSYLLNFCKNDLFNNQKESDHVIGYITPYGECRGGLLFKSLLADDWSNMNKNKSSHREQAHLDFVHIVSSLSESAAAKKNYIPATIYSYIVSQDKLAIQYLIKAFCNSSIFPHATQANANQLSNQQIAKRIYKIIELQLTDNLSENLDSLFVILQTAEKVASLFEAASIHQYKKVWDSMSEYQFFPSTQLVNKWKNSDLIYLVPRLIDVAAQCLRSRVGGLVLTGLDSPESVKLKAKSLIEVYGELPVFVNVQKYSNCLYLLRSLVT